MINFAILLGLMMAVLCVGTGAKGTASAKFDGAYAILVAAEQARDGQKWAEARRLYQAARDAYVKLAEQYPSWQASVVAFRVAHCENQLSTLKKIRQSAPVRRRPPAKPTVAKPRSKPAPAEDMPALLARARRLIAKDGCEAARDVLMQGLALDPDHDRGPFDVGCGAVSFGAF